MTLFPVICARGGKAILLAGVVGVGTGLGTWAAMPLVVSVPIAGGIGGLLGYGAAWLVVRVFFSSRKAAPPR